MSADITDNELQIFCPATVLLLDRCDGTQEGIHVGRLVHVDCRYIEA